MGDVPGHKNQVCIRVVRTYTLSGDLLYAHIDATSPVRMSEAAVIETWRGHSGTSGWRY